MEVQESLHKAAIRAIVEGIRRAQELGQEYWIILPCSRCGGEATTMNAAVQAAGVKTDEDAPIPGRPIDVTVWGPGIALNLMIETSDREEPMDENFLEEMGLETFIKEISGPEDLEELERAFRADRGIYAEGLCTNCRASETT